MAMRGIQAIEITYVNAATGLERDPPTPGERQSLAQQVIALVAQAALRSRDVVVVPRRECLPSKTASAPAAVGDQPRQAETRKAKGL